MFGNYFPQQPMQYPYTQNMQNQFAPRNDLQFVNDIESAKAYQMMPNSKQILLDKNLPRFYLVETDATGMKSVTPYDFTEVKDDPAPEYLTRQEFDVWRTNYESAIQQQQQQQNTSKPTVDATKLPPIFSESDGVHAKHERDTRWSTGSDKQNAE